MERDCESKLSKLNIEQNACIYHFGASVIHGQRSNILRLLMGSVAIFCAYVLILFLLKFFFVYRIPLLFSEYLPETALTCYEFLHGLGKNN